MYYDRPQPIVAAAALGLYFLFAIKVAEQWQKAAVLRLGRYIGLRGPGMFFIIPVIDSISQYVDQRVRVTDVKAESALTRDTVPVNVDAIIFWLVWNAEKSHSGGRGFRPGYYDERADGACANRSAVTIWRR